MPFDIEVKYVDNKGSEERLKTTYDYIFTLAQQNIIKKKPKQKGGDNKNG